MQHKNFIVQQKDIPDCIRVRWYWRVHHSQERRNLKTAGKPQRASSKTRQYSIYRLHLMGDYFVFPLSFTHHDIFSVFSVVNAFFGKRSEQHIVPITYSCNDTLMDETSPNAPEYRQVLLNTPAGFPGKCPLRRYHSTCWHRTM